MTGVWIAPRALSADGEEHDCTGMEYWLPASAIAKVAVERPIGACVVTTNGLAYEVDLDDLPRILAALGIPEPPAPRPAVSPVHGTRDHAVVGSDAPPCDYCGRPLPRRAIAAGATLCSAICARSQAEGQPSVWERGQAA